MGHHLVVSQIGICCWLAPKLVMTNRQFAMVFRWPIEIDGLPFLKMGGFSIVMLNYHSYSGFSH